MSCPQCPHCQASPEADRVFNSRKLTHFESLWSRYPVRDGKKAALKSYQASIHSEADIQRIEIALQNYLYGEKVKNGYIKNGSTWFNNWEDWVDQRPVLPAHQRTAIDNILDRRAGEERRERQIQDVPDVFR